MWLYVIKYQRNGLRDLYEISDRKYTSDGVIARLPAGTSVNFKKAFHEFEPFGGTHWIQGDLALNGKSYDVGLVFYQFSPPTHSGLLEECFKERDVKSSQVTSSSLKP
jgi:hypothetical protein